MKDNTSAVNLLDLTGKSAIVTGGARGIGYSISYRLAEAGASVLVADIDGTLAEEVANTFKANGWIAESAACDVSDEKDVKSMVNRCKEVFGSVDILVNNAGIYPISPIESMSLASFEKVIHVNLRSVFLTTRYSAEIMKAQGGGKIINITSIDALHPSAVGLAHYDASKHGAWGFTKSAALEFAPANIQINAIAPGGILTPGVASMQKGDDPTDPSAFVARIPMGRMGEPDDIGKAALFLASNMSSYMTGEQIVVDGGALLR